MGSPKLSDEDQDGRVTHAWRCRPDGVRVPRPERLPPSVRHRDAILRAHDEAVIRRSSTYRDPISGLSVFTGQFLADRGYCCESGCRHCPYE